MERAAFSPHDEVYIQYMKNSSKHNMPVQHYHDMYEIYLMLGGKRYFFYDNVCYTLERGDIAIIAPFDIHYAESRESDYYERYVVNFDTEIFSQILTPEELHVFTEKLSPCVVRLSDKQTERVYDLFAQTDECSKKHGFLSDKLLTASLLRLAAYVTECISGETLSEGKRAAPQIVSAIKYIGKHYREQIGLDDIADAACVSKYHFCRKFKEVTGATALEYLNNVRLTKVHSLLLNTDRGIAEIAADTGFSSTAQLTRVFKGVYGMSPRAFRKAQNIH